MKPARFFHNEILSFVLLIGYVNNECKLYSQRFTFINLSPYEMNIDVVEFDFCTACILA